MYVYAYMRGGGGDVLVWCGCVGVVGLFVVGAIMYVYTLCPYMCGGGGVWWWCSVFVVGVVMYVCALCAYMCGGCVCVVVV